MRNVRRRGKISRIPAAAIAASMLVSLGCGVNSVNAEDVHTYVLEADLVKLLDTAGTATLNSSGEIVDPKGKIIGVVTPNSPSVTVVKDKHPAAPLLKQRGEDIMAASLYNRIAFLRALTDKEIKLGHVKKDQRPELTETLDDAKKELKEKIDSEDSLTFKEAIDVGEKLDTVSRSLKRAAEFRAKVLPMVVISKTSPDIKQLTIFKKTVIVD